MPVSIIYTRALDGMKAPLVTVEVHLSLGMAGFQMVGLAETAVKESKDRVKSALANSHFEIPVRRIIVNLAPADLPKEGGRFDLPIALGILAASGQIPFEKLSEYEFVGELALTGELRPVRGVLPLVLAAHQAGRKIIVPTLNASEASLVKQAKTFSANHLLEVCSYLREETVLSPCTFNLFHSIQQSTMDIADVKGQPNAKRALEIAAAGKHSLLFIGPPGTGKTMLASRLPTILPEMSDEEALEHAAVISVSNNHFDPLSWKKIPFRSPHHSASNIALVGGGRPPRPGEISLAHQGILFLDELPEFSRHVLESLREPLESGCITISRAAYQSVFPAHFQFISAMNPCPCGFAGSSSDNCFCTPDQITRYANKISGPLLDRIDMHVEVSRLSPDLLASTSSQPTETSHIVRERVIAARESQLHRQGKCNALLTVPELESESRLEKQAEELLTQVITKYNWSARVYHRIVKLARTIADLERQATIAKGHISEAVQYRCLDRSKRN